MAIGASLITFVAGTTIKSADVNSNFSNINTGTFASISSDLGLITSDGAGKLIFSKGPSATNQIEDWGQGYGLYSDNTGTFAGSTSRLWFAAPQTAQVGEMHFGPRSTTNGPLNWVRFLTSNFRIDGTNETGGAGTFSILGGVATSLDAGNIATDGMGTVFVKQQAAAGAPTAALAAGTALGVGAYKYVVTFVAALGAAETSVLAATAANITTTTNNQAVNLTAIPTGPANVTGKRKIYRTKVGGSTYFLLTTLNDNTTTSFSDTTADTSLGAQAAAHPSAGGQVWQSSAGATVAQIFSDGHFAISPSGSGNAAYDAITMFGVADQTYSGNIGFGDTSFGSGAGLYAFDNKNGGFIWVNGTVNGITFTGTVTANTLSATTINGTFVTAGFGSPTNALTLLASATNAGGNRVARIQNIATLNQNADLLDLQRQTNQAQTFTFGIDSGGSFYVFDVNANAYALQNAQGLLTSAAAGVIGTHRTAGGGNAGRVTWVGTTDPGSNAAEGDVWITA